MEWINDAIMFYDTVEAWSKQKNQVEKRRYHGTVIVDGFRLKARTSAFLRERLRTDGHIYYGDEEDETDEIGYHSARVYDYTTQSYQPYEQVWLLFNDLIKHDLYKNSRFKGDDGT